MFFSPTLLTKNIRKSLYLSDVCSEKSGWMLIQPLTSGFFLLNPLLIGVPPHFTCAHPTFCTNDSQEFIKVPPNIYMCPPHFLWCRSSQTHSPELTDPTFRGIAYLGVASQCHTFFLVVQLVGLQCSVFC